MKQLIITFILILPIIVFSQETTTYEYLSISQGNEKLSITRGTEEFEVINVKEEKDKDWWDFRPLFKRIEMYENNGWEVLSSNEYQGNSMPTMHFLLRRKKN